MPTTKLSITVTGIENVLLSYNSIRVKRSTDGVDGTYHLLTANAPTPASLVAPDEGNYDIVGKTLQLLVDQVGQLDILFTGGIDPLTVAQVVEQVNEAVGDDVASDEGNHLLLTSTTTGTASKIEIVGGSAAAEFGWSGGERDIGEEAHITLQPNVSAYTFLDNDGEPGYFYKVQYYNTSSGLQSNDSSPFEGDVGTLVSSDKLTLVKVDLVDGRGIAVPNQEITFYPMHELLQVEGFQVALSRAPITIKTNNAGHAETPLVRGMRVRVVFEGTSIIRDITLPDQAETNLLTEMGAAPDPFDIAELPFPLAPRRTL
jgi:hypothetical protein